MTVIRRSISILHGTRKRFLTYDLPTILSGLDGKNERSSRQIRGVLEEAISGDRQDD